MRRLYECDARRRIAMAIPPLASRRPPRTTNVVALVPVEASAAVATVVVVVGNVVVVGEEGEKTTVAWPLASDDVEYVTVAPGAKSAGFT